MATGISNCEGSRSKTGQYTLLDDPPFSVVEAYCQDWIAGIQQGGGGTNLFITLGEVTEDIIALKPLHIAKHSSHMIAASSSNIGFYFRST